MKTLVCLAWGVVALAWLSCASAPRTLPSPGAMTQLEVSRSYDPVRRVALDPTDQFSLVDPQIVLSVRLDGYAAGSRCEFVRYWNGKYLDHGTAPLHKPGLSTVFFLWTLRTDRLPRIAGTYLVKVYVNGRYASEVPYVVH